MGISVLAPLLLMMRKGILEEAFDDTAIGQASIWVGMAVFAFAAAAIVLLQAS